MPARIDDALLLADLRRAARRGGMKTLTRQAYDVHGKFYSGTVVEHFHAWSDAIRAVGLQRFDRTDQKIATSDLLAELRLVARLLGKRRITRREYSAHSKYCAETLARRYNNSWLGALRKAGLTTGRQRYHPTAAELLADLRRVARCLGRETYTQHEYRSNGGTYSTRTFYLRFRTWNRALMAAGLTPNAWRRNIPGTELLLDLRRVANKRGEPTMTRKEYGAHGGRFSSVTIVNRYGSWPTALQLAGLKPKIRKRNVPTANLLADLRRVARNLRQRALSGQEYIHRGGRYSYSIIVRRCGSWATALLKAGLQPTPWQLSMGQRALRPTLRTIATIPGLTMEDRVKVAKTVDGVKDLSDEVIIRLFRRLNLGPVELPSGIPSGVPFWERCIQALQRVQPDPEKLKATGVLERLGRQLHRAVAIELLGREPLSPTEEQQVATELQRRKAA